MTCNWYQYNKLNLIGENKTELESPDISKLNTIIIVSILIIGIIVYFALHQTSLTFTMAAKDYLANGSFLIDTLTNSKDFILIILMIAFAVIISLMKNINWGKLFNIISIGLLFSVIAFALIASFTSFSPLLGGETVFIQSFVLLIIAESLVLPTLSYIIYRSSPRKHKGLFQGISTITFAIGNGLLFLGAIIYENNSSMAFIIFTIILILAVIMVLALKKVVNNKQIEIIRKRND